MTIVKDVCAPTHRSSGCQRVVQKIVQGGVDPKERLPGRPFPSDDLLGFFADGGTSRTDPVFVGLDPCAVVRVPPERGGPETGLVRTLAGRRERVDSISSQGVFVKRLRGRSRRRGGKRRKCGKGDKKNPKHSFETVLYLSLQGWLTPRSCRPRKRVHQKRRLCNSTQRRGEARIQARRTFLCRLFFGLAVFFFDYFGSCRD